MKLWAGRFSKQLDTTADSFNSSISFDYKLANQDIKGSLAHAKMLKTTGIITNEDYQSIKAGLEEIKADLLSGKLNFDLSAEDIHMFIEAELTKRIGDAGKRLHTARSRNDQVALDLKLYSMEKSEEIATKLAFLVKTLCNMASENLDTIMPGYTHLQPAQPITFAHHIMAYSQMFLRDIERLYSSNQLAKKECPLGSGALAGTTYPIDRWQTATELGFYSPSLNSIDGVSDRDFALQLLSNLSIIMVHLSRFCEEIILWSSLEYSFIFLDDGYSTGSSIMPQKKNPDIAELIRGKTGRVNGNLLALLTTMKSLPLAYNKDMQEDKEVVFDSVDTVMLCLDVFTPMIESITVNKAKMRNSCSKGFLNATDMADYLVKQGMPFRSAYKIVGELVGYCVKENLTLEDLSLEILQKSSPLFSSDVYDAISLKKCVKNRTSYGGTGTVENQIAETLNQLGKWELT